MTHGLEAASLQQAAVHDKVRCQRSVTHQVLSKGHNRLSLSVPRINMFTSVQRPRGLRVLTYTSTPVFDAFMHGHSEIQRCRGKESVCLCPDFSPDRKLAIEVPRVSSCPYSLPGMDFVRSDGRQKVLEKLTPVITPPLLFCLSS